MIKNYTFFDGGTISFDDEKKVKELIRYAFDEFDYYEPIGIEYVTIFQCHHSKTNTGWFTKDTNNSCCDEIENPDELCFAYYVPEVFYFAEGGWGHHMRELGNHPEIPNPVDIKLRFGGNSVSKELYEKERERRIKAETTLELIKKLINKD